jgi:hypothetical protein
MLTSKEQEKVIFTGDDHFDEILRICIQILSTKGNDYSIGSIDRLHNFRTCSNFMGITPKEALGVYLYKHIAAIYTYIKNDGQSESEPIETRIADVINYMLLLYKMVKEEKVPF